MRLKTRARVDTNEVDRPFLLSIFFGLAAATVSTGAIAAMLAWTMTP
jgi:hypothetical protein